MKIWQKLLATTLVGSTLMGCANSDNSDPEVICEICTTVVASVASDFGSSELTVVNPDDPYDIIQGYGAQDLSDITVASNGEHFYRLGRSSQNNITKYRFDNPRNAVWQFSTGANSNPYDLIFVNESKAYVLRYGAGSIWVVNPSVSADDEANFLLSEIDLSRYDTDGIPNMSAAVLHNGQLFVAMQVQDPTFTPQTAMVAVIDTTTDTEVDTDGDGANGVTGITLSIVNPLDIEVVADQVYVSAIGRYFPAELTGGVERIDPTDFSTTVVVDDGALGQTDEIALISDSIGYIVDYAAFGNTSLYEFNPTTGAFSADPLTGFNGIDIQSLAINPDGNLWVGVGDATDPEIRIVDPISNTVIETIPMRNNPAKIVFTE